MTQVIIAIPARLESQRLPRKVLKDICGLPMIVRVAQQCQKTQIAQTAPIIIATDSTEVQQVVKKYGITTVITKKHSSGTERCAELANHLKLADDDIIINVQGDEPLIPPENIDQLASILIQNPTMHCATLYEIAYDTVNNPNVVKVVTNYDNRALYFSRAQIPYSRTTREQIKYKHHIGIYGYRAKLLTKTIALPTSDLEKLEKLEQLRLLENGFDIFAYSAHKPNMGGIDTEQDLSKICAFIRALK